LGIIFDIILIILVKLFFTMIRLIFSEYRFIHFGILTNVLANSYLNEWVFFLILYLIENQINKTTISLSFEWSPASFFKDFFLINCHEMDAIPFKLVSIMSMCNEIDLKSSLIIDKLFQVARTNLNKTW
jgi:hypothetical protein